MCDACKNRRTELLKSLNHEQREAVDFIQQEAMDTACEDVQQELDRVRRKLDEFEKHFNTLDEIVEKHWPSPGMQLNALNVAVLQAPVVSKAMKELRKLVEGN